MNVLTGFLFIVLASLVVAFAVTLILIGLLRFLARSPEDEEPDPHSPEYEPAPPPPGPDGMEQVTPERIARIQARIDAKKQQPLTLTVQK